MADNATDHRTINDPDLAWTSVAPLDERIDYVINSYPHRGCTQIIAAENGLEIWFHADPSTKCYEGAPTEESNFCDLLEQSGDGPINFACRGPEHGHRMFVGVFLTFTRYQPDRYSARVAAYFLEHGLIDNEAPSKQPRKHLVDLVAYARQAG